MLKPSMAMSLLSDTISYKTFFQPISALSLLPLPEIDAGFLSLPACSLVHLLTTVFPSDLIGV
jgi:hypothetical protein